MKLGVLSMAGIAGGLQGLNSYFHFILKVLFCVCIYTYVYI